jgi:hypothetical protein
MRAVLRESGTSRLKEAVNAFHRALLERTRERVPFDWAITRSNLRPALAKLGERETETSRLKEAVVNAGSAQIEIAHLPLGERGMRLFLGGLFRLAGLLAPICF